MPPLPDIIALCGAAGAGKSTLAHLLSKSPFNYHKIPFAFPLKVMLGSLLEIQGVKDNNQLHEMLYGRAKEIATPLLCGQSPRHAMQTLGTEWGRELMDSNFWIEVWRRSIKKARKIVVEDLRFQNEFLLIKELKGTTVKIIRDDVPHPEVSHISELQFPSFETDLTIVNDGEPIDMLHELQHFMGRRL